MKIERQDITRYENMDNSTLPKLRRNVIVS